MFKLPTHIKPKYLCLSILALSLCAAASTKMEDYINFTLKIEDSMGKGKITGAFAMKDNLNPKLYYFCMTKYSDTYIRQQPSET